MGESALTVHANADNSENALAAGALDHAEAGSSEQARSIAEVKKALAELDGATQWPRSATVQRSRWPSRRQYRRLVRPWRN